MLPFSINWREVLIGAFVFALILIGFGVLASVTHWPNEHDGWPLAVAVAALIAALPLIGRTLSFLQQSRASFEGPFGIKLNFSAAASVAAVGTAKLTENLLQSGVQISESSFAELNEAAVRATEQTVVVIDLEDGRAWYKTRLFAVAATAEILHAPKSLVLIGQRGGRPMQVGGMIKPRDVVKAITRSDANYARIWQRAQSYLHRTEFQLADQKQQFPRLSTYQNAFADVGQASIMFILVDQMRNPEPVPSPPATQLEGGNIHPWITLSEAEDLFDPWLVRDVLDLGKPEAEKVAAVMEAKGDVVMAIREGQYSGLIDVERAERELLRQLLVRPSAE
jgi:hypothetical protein